ncbi:class 1 isoprenoid biosynthesis enzyme [Natrinema zhouii]|uniref:Class 1 isoprenoid biosynthesis enzyme n=1 Tax=Natrinema zhouii TaxID=1710539 RepID=A0A7D6CN32_9EURY|nr:class 1 isoprenoid biosynthesis enzyme [Natrinema zhouii]QLK25557.1 class 1 isoprenoid biosynthesis enzyme [Natrinema zhouii]
MSRLSDALQSEADVNPSPALRSKVDAYADQGGLLGAFTYFFTVLETDDGDLAQTLASIPTDLFVASALHDDVIDEADGWGADRKRRLNEHVSVGDLAFANVTATVAETPANVDLRPVLETVREIGTGQLAEETFDATTATVDDAIARSEERGGIWGELAVEIIAATDRYSDSQLEQLRTIATNGLFVLTVIDDLADLPEDIENGVATLPLVCFDGDPEEYRSTEALVEAILASDVPDRLEEIIAQRQAEIDAAASDLSASLDRSNETLPAAAARALTWYCESVCSVPVAETVPSDQQRDIRDRLTGDERLTRRYVADLVEEYRYPAAVDADEIASTVTELPDEPVVQTVIRLRHLESIVDEMMHTTLDGALAELRAPSASVS